MIEWSVVFEYGGYGMMIMIGVVVMEGYDIDGGYW
jgi:hypothetical protein